jgi:hypothetical protein
MGGYAQENMKSRITEATTIDLHVTDNRDASRSTNAARENIAFGK